MRQTGVIIDKNENMATLKMQRHSACASCGACEMGDESKDITIDALNKVNAQVGDFVEVDIETTNVLKAAAIAYVIPLFMLLMGIMFGNKILKVINYNGNIETMSAIIGLGLMVITFVIIKINEPKFKKSEEYTPVITNILNQK
ncbi:SoxR reducing system RseC family protein [Tepidibacter formicigenes]|jgi:sigma-E factor negative regulatory protein RseC|uniref:Positive regulator of sigma(E), RseC/MucC n=1 Tax=Tepidibacter formicigenes DSM 15518 TaxID=1123349 RepID=A0A1M6MV58_9FIRM|nr:SoxR reducing system RseC family protein [Tepidibacter formicigenes]SHJ87280.1 positive regulator of sigma(E), RseC/MucC [Tepidibacter formicigenes DSM 15518]